LADFATNFKNKVKRQGIRGKTLWGLRQNAKAFFKNTLMRCPIHQVNFLSLHP